MKAVIELLAAVVTSLPAIGKFIKSIKRKNGRKRKTPKEGVGEDVPTGEEIGTV